MTGMSGDNFDWRRADDYAERNYTQFFDGTSAAASQVSGVVALMLEANPNLSWRDVKHLLLETVDKNPEWDTIRPNSAGYMHSYRYGFGRVNAQKTVEAASQWREHQQSLPELVITDWMSRKNSEHHSITVDANIQIEFVEVLFKTDYDDEYGLTLMIKPLTILTAPFILPQLGVAGLLSVGMWGGYVLWSLQWEFGRHQWQFLLQQLFIKQSKAAQSDGGTGASNTSTILHMFQRTVKKLPDTLYWRWKHLGSKAVKALPFYLFPAYARRWRWQGIALTVIIVLGYGNIKYLLLALLFVFPVQSTDEK